ncbi:MAG: Coenzyme F420 hydrogenase/dehydrogenase, beta subunit C-terminal domain [Phycisphaerales bacterium]
MIRLPVLNVVDVAERQMCCGCGVCAYLEPERIEMVDTLDYGRRPTLRGSAADPLGDERAGDAMLACPGVGLAHSSPSAPEGASAALMPGWGPVLRLWEGHASDPELRWAGSSGGAASALALYCIEREGMHGALHVRARDDVPYLNRTVLSRSREEILAATGSRYAPASPCDGLAMVESAPSPCVMIGKPCDVAAARLASERRPALKEKIGALIAFFCAGTPSTKGTLEMFKAMGIADPTGIASVRYRGNGWPGNATVVVRTPTGTETRSLTYAQSWGDVLQKYRQWRCFVCADHTGEFADIAVGDPWYRTIEPGEAGTSLILARTARGKELVEGAIAAGYLVARVVEERILPASQPNLLAGRGAVWGRIAALRLFGIPAPRYTNMPLFRWWRSELSLKAKAQSLYGTFKRAFTKRLFQRHRVDEFESPIALREPTKD